MAKPIISLHGFRELDEVLGRELKKPTAKAALRRALLEAAPPMAAKMRAMAPDDPETADLDRDLRQSIEVSDKAKGADAGKRAYGQALASGASKGAALAAMKSARAGGAFAEVYVGPVKSVFHGIFQEFGTSRHGAQPFMRPGFESDARPFLDRLKTERADQIGKAVSRVRARAGR